MRAVLATVYTDDSTERHPPLRLLLDSAWKFGVPVLVSGRGRRWEDSYTDKVVRFLADVRRWRWDAMLFVDARDAFLTGPGAVQAAVDALSECGRGLLVSGETNCHPWPAKHGEALRRLAAERGHSLAAPYPNSGVWTGWRDEVIALLEEAERLGTDAGDDGYSEGGFTRRNCDQQPWCEAALDGRAAVGGPFLNLYGTEGPYGDLRQYAVVHGSSPENKYRTVDMWRRLA